MRWLALVARPVRLARKMEGVRPPPQTAQPVMAVKTPARSWKRSPSLPWKFGDRVGFGATAHQNQGTGEAEHVGACATGALVDTGAPINPVVAGTAVEIVGIGEAEHLVEAIPGGVVLVSALLAFMAEDALSSLRLGAQVSGSDGFCSAFFCSAF